MASSRLARFGFFASRQLLREAYSLKALPTISNRILPLTTQVKLFSSEEASKYTNEYYEGLVKDKPLVLFMKGSPDAPMCGFSRLVVQILHMHGLKDYSNYNVLEDIDFKEGLKTFSSWPTFPQVYMGGELVGGADIMLQLHQSGDLVSELEKIGHTSALSLEKEQNSSDNS